MKSIFLLFLFISNAVFAQKLWREHFFETTDYGKKKDRNDGVFKQYDYVWAQPNGLYVVKKKVFYKDSLSTLNSFLVDKKGKIITKNVYTDIGDFSEGMAEVTTGNENFCRGCFLTGRYSYVTLGNAAAGFISEKGEEVIPPSYNYVDGVFRNGLAAVGDYRGMWFIDKEGKSKFGKVYKRVDQFFNGVASVSDRKEGENYIDTSGKKLIPDKYLYIEHYSVEFRGRIRAFQLPNGKFGFWTAENLPLIDAQFDEVNYDIWPSRILVKKENRIGFLDYYTGKIVVSFEYDAFENDKNPNYILLKKDKNWVRVNFNGEVKDLVKAETVKAINVNRYKANLGSNKWILLDSSGKILTNKNYDKIANNFKNDYLLVWEEEKAGYLDSNGIEVVPTIYDKMGSFKDNMVFAERSNKLFKIDVNGNILEEEYTNSFLKRMVLYAFLFLGVIIIVWIYKEARN